MNVNIIPPVTSNNSSSPVRYLQMPEKCFFFYENQKPSTKKLNYGLQTQTKLFSVTVEQVFAAFSWSRMFFQP